MRVRQIEETSSPVPAQARAVPPPEDAPDLGHPITSPTSAAGGAAGGAGRAPRVPAFRYAAFISYRHAETDRQWARWLHGALETYRVPRRLRRQTGLPARLGRCFRDEDELPASADLKAEIDDALTQSKYLIVVCSPRTPASEWVNREVERFRELGRGDRILALLVEGEPSQSFPRALREIRRTVVDGPAGPAGVQIDEVEPLAADVRPGRGERRGTSHTRQKAKLRLLATVLDVRFDDLRQREQERKSRRLAMVGGVLAAVTCVMAGLAAFAFTQRGEARRQAALADGRRVEADVQRAAAIEQRSAAVQQGALAERRRGEAAAEAKRAAAAERQTRHELARSTAAEGYALLLAGRPGDSRDTYRRATTQFSDVGLSPLVAQLGIASTYRESPFDFQTTQLGGNSRFEGVAVSPDGRLALIGVYVPGHPPINRLVDLPTWHVVRTFEGYNQGDVVRNLAFLPGGESAVLAGGRGLATVWDLKEAKPVRTFTVPAEPDRRHRGLLSSNGRRLLAIQGTSLQVWDTTTGAAVRTLPPLPSRPEFAHFGPDGRHVLAAGDGWVRVVDADTGATIASGASRKPSDGRLSADGAVAYVLSSVEGTLTRLDARTGVAAAVLTVAGRGDFTWMDLSSDARLIALAGERGVNAVDPQTGRVIHRLASGAGHNSGAVAITPDGRMVLADATANVHLWPVAPSAEPDAVRIKSGVDFQTVEFSPDSRLVLTRDSPGAVRLWDATTGLRVADVTAARPSRAACFLPDARVMTGDDRGGVVVWDPRPGGGGSPAPFESEAAVIEALAVSPDGRRVAGAGKARDGTPRLWAWDTASRKQVWAVDASGAVQQAVSFSPDGRWIVSYAQKDQQVSQWDAATGRRLWFREGRSGDYAACPPVFAPGGMSLLAGRSHNQGDLMIIGPDGAPTTFLPARHTGQIAAVRYLPPTGGALAASASWDGTVKVWDLAAGRDLCTFRSDDGDRVFLLAAAPDGTLLYSTAGRRELVLRDPSLPDRLSRSAAVRDRAGRDLQKNPADGGALGDMAAWWADRGVDDWAVKLADQARARGVPPPPLPMARCYWRLGRLTEARREFDAVAAMRGADEPYLRLCLRAVGGPPPPPDARRVDLLPLVDPAADAAGGRWSMRDGVLASDADRYAMLRLRYRPPAEYDFRVEFERTDGRDSVSQIVSAAGGTFEWCMDSAGNGNLYSIQSVARRGFKDSPAQSYPGALRNGQRHVSLLQVRKGGVRAFLDGRLLADWKTDFRDVTVFAAERWGATPPPLGLRTWESPTRFFAVQVYEVTGSGSTIAS